MREVCWISLALTVSEKVGIVVWEEGIIITRIRSTNKVYISTVQTNY